VGLASWISLERKSVTLAAGESEIVDFEVEVPRDADSGEHVGGISVWSPAGHDVTDAAAPGQADAAVHIQTRRILAVQVNLPGASRPELVVSGIDAAARPDGLYLEIDIENAGRGLTTGQGFVEIPAEGFHQSFDVDTFVPGTSIAYPVRWTDSAPEGEYEARVEIDFEGGTATWQGAFTVGKAVLQELAQRGVRAPDRSGFPWWAVTVAVGAVAIAAVVLIRRRRPHGAQHVPSRIRAKTPVHNVRREHQPPPIGLSRRITPPPPPPPAVGDRHHRRQS